MQVIDPRELNDLAAFAARGGLGTGTAISDCVAEQPDQLMYLTGDALVLLRDLGPILLASCEGVVGWVRKQDVEFDKMASSSEGHEGKDIPRTVVVSPSPPSRPIPLPPVEDSGLKVEKGEDKRVSNPFDLDSPLSTPGVEATQQGFLEKEKSRESVDSVASSGYGGIGGFMMAGSEDEHESGPVSPPHSVVITTPSDPQSLAYDIQSPTSDKSGATTSSKDTFDIYDTYARESVVPKTKPLVIKPTSPTSPQRLHVVNTDRQRDSVRSVGTNGSWDDEGGAFEAARLALEKIGRQRKWIEEEPIEEEKKPDSPPPRPARRQPEGANGTTNSPPGKATPETPKAAPESPDAFPVGPTTPYGSRSMAMEIRNRIQRKESVDDDPKTPVAPKRSPAKSEASPPRLTIANPDVDDSPTPSSDNHESDTSTELITPNPPPEVIFAEPAPIETSPPKMTFESHRISKVEPIVAKLDPRERMTPTNVISGPPKRGASFAPPVIPAASAWKPGSPSSPHSATATRQAVEAVRKTPEGKRPNLTLVGRMNGDLSQASGPMPITFLVGNPTSPNVGLGPPPNARPMERRATSPLAPSPVALAPPFMENPVAAMKNSESPYPPIRSPTAPPPAMPVSISPPSSDPKPGFFPRPRSRSFSAAMNRALSSKKSNPNLTIKTDIPAVPSVPSDSSSFSAGTPVRRPFFGRTSSIPGSAPAGSSLPTPTSPAALSPDIIGFVHSNESTPSLYPPSARSSSFSFNRKNSRPSKGPSISPVSGTRPLPSPVSNKDYEDTVKADGLDFEIIQPKRSLLSPGLDETQGAELERKGTVISSTSGRSLKTLPDTDEWGFIKEKSPTPEIFTGRAGGAGQRQTEQKWLGIVASPPQYPLPKKVRKFAVEFGVPASLRGRVWAWFMASHLSARRPGLYQELLDHDRGDKAVNSKIDQDVESAYPDHSIYSETSTGQSDLRNILRAYSQFATGGYRSEMSLVAGMLLIHCVAEDAFWLLSGFVNGVLKDYYATPSPSTPGQSTKAVGLRVDAAVFAGVLAGSEPKLSKLFRDIGLHPIMFLEQWYSQLFIRCLPWPTALRVIDAVIAEGSRFLLIASLTVLTLSRERILALPKAYGDVLAYLKDLPQDALLLPEGFMKACENVKFREEDLKRLRSGVEKELGIA